MDKIYIGIYDEHTLVQQGIKALLKDYEDIEIILTENSKAELFKSLKTTEIHILLINIHEISTSNFNLIVQINVNFPRIRVLTISVHNHEEMILRTIKAGAKGFLSRETTRDELIEAVYTLRNGHDYYSKSITHLLLNRYISRIKEDDNDASGNLGNLSSREQEILKLWGSSYTNQEIAEKLYISIRTVESHKNHIMQKLNLKTSVDLVKFAIKNNIIEI